MHIEVAYATAEHQWLIPLSVADNTSAQAAIEQSGILTLCPEIQQHPLHIGIFSQPITPTHRLNPGDRVEIYRPLLIDPKDKRRAHARTTYKKKHQRHA